MEIDPKKLHRHGKAHISISQAGEEIEVEVHGNKYDLLHMLMAVVGKKNTRLSSLIREAVFRATAKHVRSEIEQIKKQAERLRGKIKKERTVH